VPGVVLKITETQLYNVRIQKYYKALKRFKEANKTRNAEIAVEFLAYKEAQGIGANRLMRILETLKLFCQLAPKDFDKFEQKDLLELARRIRRLNHKEWTKVTNLKILKNFAKWLKKKYSLELDETEIKTENPKNSMLPEYLITPQEFNRLMNATDDLQTKVLLGLLYESGARIGEILSLKIQNVSFNQYGARIRVQGKTGARVIPIVWFANLLRQLLEIHPLRDVPEAPLFYTTSRNGEIVPLSYYAFRMRLQGNW